MLDNGSRDGSAEAARAHPAVDETIALAERRGKALQRLRAAAPRPRALRAAAERGLRAAARRDARAVARRCRRTRARPARARGCCAPTARRQASRVALPDAAHGARRRAVPAPPATPSRAAASASREVDWCQSAALLVRREAAAQVGYLDPDFFVYSDEVDFARRLRDAGWRSLYVPGAAAIHHEQLSTDADARAADRRNGAQPRPVHAQAPLAGGGAGGALADGLELRAARARRARAAGPLARGATGATSRRRCAPGRGEGLREAAAEYNRSPERHRRSAAACAASSSSSAVTTRAIQLRAGHPRAAPRRPRRACGPGGRDGR